MSQSSKVTFNDVGGLDKQITDIKEMLLFPLLYRNFTTKHGIKAPKGVLFHGPPGTGKTLLASALANECSLDGRPMTFISRKGADILDPFLGQSELRLRQVFAQARMHSPAIIFFDEIDALAPSRNTLGLNGHHHVSIVATLLTEMDGIGTAAGGDIFVIGATNRIDSIDPALRRPGRFDREIRFSLPSCEVSQEDLMHACSKFVPAAHRTEAARGKSLESIMEPIFRETIDTIIARLVDKFPYRYLHGDQQADHAVYSQLSVPQLLLTGTEEHGLTSHLVPAILHAFEHLPVVAIDMDILFAEGAHATDVACIKAIRRAKECLPCILYVPDVTSWWDIVGESTQRIFCTLIRGIEEGTKLLLVATGTKHFEDMPMELQQVFREKLAVTTPSTEQRERFFAPLLLYDITGSTASNRQSGDYREHREEQVASPLESSKRGSCGDQNEGGFGDERRSLLQRLVVATSGYPSLPLERAYGALSARFNCWADHGDSQRLLEGLVEVVQQVEDEARDRASSAQGLDYGVFL